MDAKQVPSQTERNISETEPVSELAAWFSVSGDMDDFIFYDEPLDAHSER